MLLTAYRAAEVRVNIIKDNIKIVIKEIAIMITRTEYNFINTYSKYCHF